MGQETGTGGTRVKKKERWIAELLCFDFFEGNPAQYSKATGALSGPAPLFMGGSPVPSS